MLCVESTCFICEEDILFGEETLFYDALKGVVLKSFLKRCVLKIVLRIKCMHVRVDAEHLSEPRALSRFVQPLRDQHEGEPVAQRPLGRVEVVALQGGAQARSRPHTPRILRS